MHSLPETSSVGQDCHRRRSKRKQGVPEPSDHRGGAAYGRRHGESEAKRELCRQAASPRYCTFISTVLHFSFYQGIKKVHEEEGVKIDQLTGDVLYY
jgi:hypothetical protein